MYSLPLEFGSHEYVFERFISFVRGYKFTMFVFLAEKANHAVTTIELHLSHLCATLVSRLRDLLFSYHKLKIFSTLRAT